MSFHDQMDPENQFLTNPEEASGRKKDKKLIKNAASFTLYVPNLVERPEHSSLNHASGKNNDIFR